MRLARQRHGNACAQCPVVALDPQIAALLVRRIQRATAQRAAPAHLHRACRQPEQRSLNIEPYLARSGLVARGAHGKRNERGQPVGKGIEGRINGDQPSGHCAIKDAARGALALFVAAQQSALPRPPRRDQGCRQVPCVAACIVAQRPRGVAQCRHHRCREQTCRMIRRQEKSRCRQAVEA